jgi:hypothetical protein
MGKRCVQEQAPACDRYPTPCNVRADPHGAGFVAFLQRVFHQKPSTVFYSKKVRRHPSWKDPQKQNQNG